MHKEIRLSVQGNRGCLCTKTNENDQDFARKVEAGSTLRERNCFAIDPIAQELSIKFCNKESRFFPFGIPM